MLDSDEPCAYAVVDPSRYYWKLGYAGDKACGWEYEITPKSKDDDMC